MENNRTIKDSLGIVIFILFINGALIIANNKLFNSSIITIIITLIAFSIFILGVEKKFSFFHKFIYIFFSLLSLLIGYGAYNQNSNTTASEINHLTYSDYKDCGKDINKWKEVINDLYDKAVGDIADDGIWNNDGENAFDTWEDRRSNIFNNLEKIVDEKFKSEVYNYENEKLKNIDKEYPKVKVTETLYLELIKKFNLNY